MADVTLAVNAPTGEPPMTKADYETGLTAGDRYLFANDGRVRLIVRKASGTDSVLTFVTTKEIQGLAVADPTRTAEVEADSVYVLGPFSIDLYGETVGFTATEESNLSLAVARV